MFNKKIFSNDIDKMSSVQKQRVHLTPNNQPNGSTYSAQNYPAINFIIGRQPAWLETKSLRLNGTFTLTNVAGVGVVNNTAQAGGSGAQVPGSGATLNNFIGVSSLFDEVTVSTLNGRNLETVRSYNRMLASSKGINNSSLEYSNGLGLKDPTMTNKSITNAKTVNQEIDFSIPIDIGMFDGGKLLNISEKGFHGLQLDFLLAQNSSVVQPFFKYTNTKIPIAASATFNYAIKNLSLTFDLIRADDRLFASLPSSGTLSYQTISTLHSTLLSSDQTINLRFGASNVISTTHSIIPSLHVNNLNVDSFRQCEPEIAIPPDGDGTVAKVKNVQYMRAGVLYPYDFMLDSEKQADLDNLGNPAVQSQIMKPYMNSVSLYNNSANKFNPNTNLGINCKNQPGGPGTPLPLQSASDPRTAFGLGVPMDSNRQGVSFKDREYAIRIQSELNDTDANAFFTFTRVRNIAAYSPTGINVIE